MDWRLIFVPSFTHLGPVDQMRKINKQVCNFGNGGYTAIWTPKFQKPNNDHQRMPPPSSYGRESIISGGGGSSGVDGSGGMFQQQQKAFDHIALFPTDDFLRAFGDPSMFAANLQERSEDVVREHNKVNRNIRDPKQWTPADRSFTLMRHDWKAARNVSHASEQEMQLSTWSFKAKTVSRMAKLHLPPERLSMSELKAIIKMRTTLGAHTTVDKNSVVENFIYNNLSYNQRAPHVIGFFRSSKVQAAIAKIREIRLKQIRGEEIGNGDDNNDNNGAGLTYHDEDIQLRSNASIIPSDDSFDRDYEAFADRIEERERESEQAFSSTATNIVAAAGGKKQQQESTKVVKKGGAALSGGRSGERRQQQQQHLRPNDITAGTKRSNSRASSSSSTTSVKSQSSGVSTAVRVGTPTSLILASVSSSSSTTVSRKPTPLGTTLTTSTKSGNIGGRKNPPLLKAIDATSSSGKRKSSVIVARASSPIAKQRKRHTSRKIQNNDDDEDNDDNDDEVCELDSIIPTDVEESNWEGDDDVGSGGGGNNKQDRNVEEAEEEEEEGEDNEEEEDEV